jgi:hypothetical protein
LTAIVISRAAVSGCLPSHVTKSVWALPVSAGMQGLAFRSGASWSLWKSLLQRLALWPQTRIRSLPVSARAEEAKVNDAVAITRSMAQMRTINLSMCGWAIGACEPQGYHESRLEEGRGCADL